jgi:dipeptidyl aminopeptidase/acylaminoacyl peptidase
MSQAASTRRTRRAPFAFVLFALTCCVALPASSTRAQQPSPSPTPTPAPPPDTDIFIVEMKTANGRPEFGRPTNVTNRPGYDNQPSFTPDGRAVLFTSQREGNQTDVYRYDLSNAGTTRLTATPESEYSPTVTPDGKFFSVVRVEADQAQRLWKFPLAGTGQPALVMTDVKPVGYHLWLDARTLALFVLGAENRPHTLQVAVLGKRPGEVVELSTMATNIGRSFQRVPNQRDGFTFVHKLAPDNWLIKIVDLKSHRTAPLAKTLPGSEDYARLPDGSLLMARDAKLYRLDPAAGQDWQEIADFTPACAAACRITRLAVSPRADRLAFVAQPALSQ